MGQKIIVIGSGIAGASSAYFLSDNHDVTIVEKNSHFKKTCSGVVTHAIDDIVTVPNNLIKNKIHKIRINAPNREYIEINLKKPDYIVDREKLNKYFTYKAINKGAKLIQPAKFIRINKKGVEVKINNRTQIINTDILVGADGAQSSVAKACGLYGNRKFFLGIKANVKMCHDNLIDIFPNIGLFSWIIPCNDDSVEIGTFCYLSQNKFFDYFLKKVGIKEESLLSKEAALIPFYNSDIQVTNKYKKIDIYLIGDAATTVKATTGGGIFQSIKAATLLSKCLDNGINYQKELEKKLGRGLWLHLKIRNVLDKFSINDWNNLIGKFNNKKLVETLQKENRDYPIKLVAKLLINDPRLFYLLKFLF